MLVMIMIKICKVHETVSRNKFSVNYGSMYEHVCMSAARHEWAKLHVTLVL